MYKLRAVIIRTEPVLYFDTMLSRWIGDYNNRYADKSCYSR